MAHPVFGLPTGLPGKIIRLPGKLVHTATPLFFRPALSNADRERTRTIAMRKPRDGGLQGYKPANTGAFPEGPFAPPAKVLSSAASKAPSHAPPA